MQLYYSWMQSNEFNSLHGNQVDSIRSALRNFRLNIDGVVDVLMWLGNALYVWSQGGGVRFRLFPPWMVTEVDKLIKEKPIDNKPSHWVLPPGHWRIKLNKSVGYSMQIIMFKFDAEIKSYKDGKTIWIYHNHYLACTNNSKLRHYVCNCYYYDRAVHISVAVDMHTLLDRKNFSFRPGGST